MPTVLADKFPLVLGKDHGLLRVNIPADEVAKTFVHALIERS
jgi:hypothetical protein